MKLSEIVSEIAFTLAFGAAIAGGSMCVMHILEPCISTELLQQTGILCALGAISIMSCRNILFNVVDGLAKELAVEEDDDN